MISENLIFNPVGPHIPVFDKIPDYAILVYTVGSRSEVSHYGCGIYIRAQDNSCQFNLRNPDGCFIFRDELITIDSVFNNILSFPFSGSMWILTGSRSAILLLSNGHKVGDNTGVAVFEKHIAGYEIANTSAKHGAVQHPNSLAPLIYAELQSSYNRYK
ncbi:RNase H domain-containing protein [Nephila pilipes]|uniref:RNase H domain-containing protein n=1 Tax=Nephila pilipes TaxID=299642 RepID=A0A8X6T637_NEPPI|nr:RNase H domain-containing protein [Nephila pilipes]